MMKRVCLAAVFAATVIGAGVAAAPTAQCQGDCPAYNSPCISDLGCKPLQCDMRCVSTESGRSRCR